MESPYSTWRVVLVRPRNPLNIGAAARAMANFGFRDLVVVAPYAPVWQETRSAVGAEEIILRARAVDKLVDAIADSTLVIGTTAGSRRNLDRNLVPLDTFSNWLREREARQDKQNSSSDCGGEHASLLFGSEKTGLSSEDLSYCHALVRIPTVIECPSMNLGQAVAVCCYELARSRSETTLPPAEGSNAPRIHVSEPANVQAMDHVFERAARVLDRVGYFQPKSRSAAVMKLRRFLFDRALTSNDVKILGSVLAQVEWKLKVLDEREENAEQRT